MNVMGLIAALSTFFSVWFGHVAVRKIESRVRDIRPPMVVFALVGFVFGYFSLTAADVHISAALGILCVTSLWDSFEFHRQQKRVISGHAPANPENPRHAALLAASPKATPLDLLARNPVGRSVSAVEAVQLLKGE